MDDSTGCDKVGKCQVTLTSSINMSGSPLLFPAILLAHFPSWSFPLVSVVALHQTIDSVGLLSWALIASF
jgi:hypothetical protein